MLILKLSILILLLSGCAKVAYLTEQGIGQVKLQWSGEDNKKLLKDPKFNEEWKQKIRLVEQYKKFFYEYYKIKPTKTYSETSILKDEAVTYLVIASPHREIKAHEFSFPIFGSFPYLGFFSEKSAKDFAADLRKNENLVTWIRPVYAYSTLGYLEDKILSSFFHYNDIELAELVFHELFHTAFFVKDDVDLNENLADYFAVKMMPAYFESSDKFLRYQRIEKIRKRIYQHAVDKVAVLNAEFTKLGEQLTDSKADELTATFSNEVLVPALKNICAEEELTTEECEIKNNWNQAKLAAMLTYEEEQEFIEALHTKLNVNNIEFLYWLKAKYKEYKRQDKHDNFTDYLKTYL